MNAADIAMVIVTAFYMLMILSWVLSDFLDGQARRRGERAQRAVRADALDRVWDLEDQIAKLRTELHEHIGTRAISVHDRAPDGEG